MPWNFHISIITIPRGASVRFIIWVATEIADEAPHLSAAAIIKLASPGNYISEFIERQVEVTNFLSGALITKYRDSRGPSRLRISINGIEAYGGLLYELSPRTRRIIYLFDLHCVILSINYYEFGCNFNCAYKYGDVFFIGVKGTMNS